MSGERDVVVADMLYPRLAAPDLGELEEFLTAFGMVKVERTGTKLFMRGTGTSHHLYVAELGDPRFLGIAFGVDDPEVSSGSRPARAPVPCTSSTSLAAVNGSRSPIPTATEPTWSTGRPSTIPSTCPSC